MNTYEQKLQDRAERYATRAEKLERLSTAAYASARASVDGIPLGQPILVGHHSERRHRRALERHNQRMRAAVEAGNRAKYWAERAASVGSAGISSSDPEAIDKLERKLKASGDTHTLMVDANKEIRRLLKLPEPERIAPMVSWLLDNGIKKADEMAHQLLTKNQGCFGFPSYTLTNSKARINDVKSRIERLQRRAAIVAQLEAETGSGERETIINNVRIVEALADNRLRMYFDGKPPVAVRDALKHSGFRWAPSEGAWSAYLNNRARQQAPIIARMGVLS